MRGFVIELHRPSGHPVVVNADLVETVERDDAGATVVMLTTGTLVMVTEAPDAVRLAAIAYRRSIGGGR